MRTYTIIETGDIEILGIFTYSDLDKANKAFDKLEMSNHSIPVENLKFECYGTLRLSGDESYALQLIESELD